MLIVIAQNGNVGDRNRRVPILRVRPHDHPRNIVQIIIAAKQPLLLGRPGLERAAAKIRYIELQRNSLKQMPDKRN